MERHHSLYRPATVNSHLKRSAAAAVAEAEGAAPAGPGSVRDWAAVREEVFPPSDSNSCVHLLLSTRIIPTSPASSFKTFRTVAARIPPFFCLQNVTSNGAVLAPVS